MLPHGWILKALFWVKEARLKRLFWVYDFIMISLHEIFRTGRSTETEISGFQGLGKGYGK